MNIKKAIGVTALAVAALAVIYVVGFSSATQPSSGKLKVAASFYPMGEFARQIGGDRAEVTVLVKPGVEPHDYDPTPSDIAGVHKSKLLIYNGAGLEPWADKIKRELENEGTVVAVASEGLTLKAKDDALKAQDPDDQSPNDPHVWLDPVLASGEVDHILAAFIKADPADRSIYEKNAANYKQQLAALDQDFRTGLSQCSSRDIVTSHQAFGYLSARYGFNAVGISGLSPDEEPSPQKLAEVAQFARINNVKYIFFESLTSPKLSDTIAQEVGAKTLVFNPLEGLIADYAAAGQNYLTEQRSNLANLKIALNCK